MKELSELSAEVDAISYIILGLTLNLGNEESDKLNDDKLGTAMFGVASYLDRIAEDMDRLEVEQKA